MPEWVGLRADAALACGDLPGFITAVDTGVAGPQREAVAPLMRALAPAIASAAATSTPISPTWPPMVASK